MGHQQHANTVETIKQSVSARRFLEYPKILHGVENECDELQVPCSRLDHGMVATASWSLTMAREKSHASRRSQLLTYITVQTPK